jgi:hypothetical protein
MSRAQLQDGIALTMKAVQLNDFLLIDDHDPDGGKTQLGGCAVYERDGKQVVVALFTKAFSDYYTINEIVIKEDGLPHLTHNACGGTMHSVTNNIHHDVIRMEASFDQVMIEKYPALKPGKIFNIITPATAR